MKYKVGDHVIFSVKDRKLVGKVIGHESRSVFYAIQEQRDAIPHLVMEDKILKRISSRNGKLNEDDSAKNILEALDNL